MRLAALVLLLVPLTAFGADPTEPKGKAKRKDDVKMPDNAKKATARALAWLAKQQNSDGSWSEARYPHNPAITAFAVLAFLSQGHLPNQGTYGKEIAKASRYLTSCGT